MRLVLVGDDGEYLDDVPVAQDELDYAQQDGGAATLLLGELLPQRYEDGQGKLWVMLSRQSKNGGVVYTFNNDLHPTDV